MAEKIEVSASYTNCSSPVDEGAISRLVLSRDGDAFYDKLGNKAFCVLDDSISPFTIELDNLGDYTALSVTPLSTTNTGTAVINGTSADFTEPTSGGSTDSWDLEAKNPRIPSAPPIAIKVRVRNGSSSSDA